MFGDTVHASELKLDNVFKEISKFVIGLIVSKKGSFIVEVDDMIGLAIKEKYGFK